MNNDRSDNRQITVSEHGDEYRGRLMANFSSNVWYGANHTQLFSYLSTKMDVIYRYPEQKNEQLRIELASWLGTEADKLLINNGTIESIYLIAQAYSKCRSLIVCPTFSEYARACSLNSHLLDECEDKEIEKKIDSFKPQLVWICTPNNPDGSTFQTTYLKYLLKKFPDVHFIIDVSFREYCTEEQPTTKWIEEFQNITLLYSFTKRYSIPGLRIGYICSSSHNISRFAAYASPWSVNALAAEALRFIMYQYVDSFSIIEWLKEKKRFTEMINSIEGFSCIDSQTPFFLVMMTQGTASELKKYLLKNEILIRDASTFFNSGKQYIRLITLSPDENNLLIKHLQVWKP